MYAAAELRFHREEEREDGVLLCARVKPFDILCDIPMNIDATATSISIAILLLRAETIFRFSVLFNAAISMLCNPARINIERLLSSPRLHLVKSFYMHFLPSLYLSLPFSLSLSPNLFLLLLFSLSL